MKVGELFAELRLDGGDQYARDVDNAGRKTEELASKAKQASDATEELGRKTQQASQKTEQATQKTKENTEKTKENAQENQRSSKAMEVLGNAARATGESLGVMVKSATVAVAGLTGGLLKTGIAYNGLQQRSRAALTTMLGSAEAANAQMDKLDDFARNSPFAKEVFVKAQQQMIAFGFAAEDVIPTLNSVQDAVAAAGGTNDDIAAIVDTMSKIQATGKITARELMEFGNRGIDAASLIGQAFGKTGAEIREEITAGTLDANKALTALTQEMGKKFEGAAANVKQTWVGATDRVRAAWRDLGSDLAKPFVDPRGGGMAIKWANDLADVMRAMQAKVEPIMGAIMRTWGSEMEGASSKMQALAKRIEESNFTSGFEEGLQTLKEYTPVIAGLTGAFAAWSTASLPIIGGINPIVAGVMALAAATPELRGELGGLVAASGPLMEHMGEIGKSVGDLAMMVVSDVAPAFLELAGAVIEAVAPLAGPMVDAAQILVKAAEPLINIIGGAVEVFASLPSPVLAAIGAFALLRTPIRMLTQALPVMIGDLGKLSAHMGGLGGLGRTASRGISAMGGALMAALTGNWLTIGLAALGVVVHLASSVEPAPTEDLADAMLNLARNGKTASNSLDTLVNTKLQMGPFRNEIRTTEELVDKFAETMKRAFNPEITKTPEGKYVGPTKHDINRALDLIHELDGALAHMVSSGHAEEAQKMLNALLNSLADENLSMSTREIINEFTKLGEITGGIVPTVDEFGNKVYELAPSEEEAAEAARELADAQAELAGVLQTQRGDIDALIDAKRRLAGESTSAKDAEIAHSKALDGLTAAIEDETFAVNEAGTEWDGYTAAGQKAHAASQDLASAMWDTAEAMANQGDSSEEISAKLEGMRGDFIEAATTMGMTQEAAEALADSYGMVPEDIATTVSLDHSEALGMLGDFVLTVDETTGTIMLDGDPTPGETKLADLVEGIENADGTITINGHTVPAEATLDELVEAVKSTTGNIEIDADDSAGRNILDLLSDTVRKTSEAIGLDAEDSPARKTLGILTDLVLGTTEAINIDGDDSLGQTALRLLKNKADRTKGTMKVGGDNSAAKLAIKRAVIHAGQSPATVDITANPAPFWSVVGRLRGTVVGRTFMQLTGIGMADGGIIHSYASGGIENHVAQIAPAGAWRVWAEPETGGEAYIPLAPSKRDRSEKILAEVAAHFGRIVIPAQATSYASGGTHAVSTTAQAPAGAGAPAAPIINITVNPEDLRGLQSLQEFVEKAKVWRAQRG